MTCLYPKMLTLLLCMALCSCKGEDSIGFNNQTESDVSITKVSRGERVIFLGNQVVPRMSHAYGYSIGRDKAVQLVFAVRFHGGDKEILTCQLKFSDDPRDGCHYAVLITKKEKRRTDCVCQSSDSD